MWWGRPDLNRRPLPKNSVNPFFTGFSRHAPELRHSSGRGQQTRCLLLEPVLMPRSAEASQSHTCLDYDPTVGLGQLSEPATIKIIRFSKKSLHQKFTQKIELPNNNAKHFHSNPSATKQTSSQAKNNNFNEITNYRRNRVSILQLNFYSKLQ